MWKKELEAGAFAVLFFSRSDRSEEIFRQTMEELGFNDTCGYRVRDLFAGKDLDHDYMPLDFLSVEVDPSGVVLLKVTPLSGLARGNKAGRKDRPKLMDALQKARTNTTKH